jgi:hypothetical protein
MALRIATAQCEFTIEAREVDHLAACPQQRNWLHCPMFTTLEAHSRKWPSALCDTIGSTRNTFFSVPPCKKPYPTAGACLKFEKLKNASGFLGFGTQLLLTLSTPVQVPQRL